MRSSFINKGNICGDGCLGYGKVFSGGQDTVARKCRITAAGPEKKLSYTWRYEDYSGDSEVSFELFPDGEKTLVRITHTGLDTMPQNNPDFASESFDKGWNYILGESLKKFVE